MGKRKRGSADLDEDEKTMEVPDRDSPPASNRARKELPATAMSSLASRQSSTASRRSVSLKGASRGSNGGPTGSSSSLSGSGGSGSKGTSLPTAVAVFGLGSMKSDPDANGSAELDTQEAAKEGSVNDLERLVTDLPRKRRVLAADEVEAAHRGNATELPDDMEGMKLS